MDRGTLRSLDLALGFALGEIEMVQRKEGLGWVLGGVLVLRLAELGGAQC